MGANGGKGTYSSMDNMPSDITGLRGDIVSWLQNQGRGGGAGVPNAGGGTTPSATPSGPSSAEAFEKKWAEDRKAFEAADLADPSTTPEKHTTRMAFFDQGKDQQKTNYMRTTPGALDFGGIFSTAAPQAPIAQAGGVTVPTLQRPGDTIIGPIGNADYKAIGVGGATPMGNVAQSTSAAIQHNPEYQRVIDMIMGSSGTGLAGQATAGQADSVTGMVQSLDQLAGQKNQYFENQVMDPYRKFYAQTRATSLADATERSGNLTGTGFANNLGNTVNRSISEENKALTDVLTQLSQFEIQRQKDVAKMELDRRLGNAGFTTEASIANAGNTTTANLGALDAKGKLAGIFSGEAMNTASRADVVDMFNKGEINKATMDFLQREDVIKMFDAGEINKAGVQQAIANAQSKTQAAIAQGQITSNESQNFFNQQVLSGLKQAELTQNNNQFNTGQTNQGNQFTQGQANTVGMANANNFIQLLMGMAGTGVGGSTPTYTPGAVDALAELSPFIGKLFGGKSAAPATGGK